MIQQWMNVAGLTLDLAGFGLLLREWWIAFFNEGTQIAMEEQLQRTQSMRSLHRSRPVGERNPFETLERMQDEQAMRKARSAHRDSLAARKRVFIAATVLIVLGFVLQVGAGLPLHVLV